MARAAEVRRAASSATGVPDATYTTAIAELGWLGSTRGTATDDNPRMTSSWLVA